jgi:UPF0755 protein
MNRLSVNKIAALVSTLIFFGIVFQTLFSQKELSETVTFTINEGESLKSLSNRLGEAGLVSSPVVLRMYLSFNDKDRKVQLGEYEFSDSVSLFGVAREITDKGPKNPLLSVTVPEGSTSLEVFELFQKALPKLNKDTFLETVNNKEANGKLFPSTYHLLPSYNENVVIDLMTNIYVKKVTPIFASQVAKAPLTGEGDVLILASILEGEANREKDMQIVAGILLKRMVIGMPLQVDVAMETYKKRGLPKNPINNPGLLSIEAVLNPIYSDYLYYITGKDGLMYYAKTFDEHKRNISKYLK